MVLTCSVEVGVPVMTQFSGKVVDKSWIVKVVQVQFGIRCGECLGLQSRKVSQSIEFLTYHSSAFCTLQLVIHAVCDSNNVLPWNSLRSTTSTT